MRFRSFQPDEVLLKNDDPEAEVHFEAYGAIFGNRDLGREMIHPGAFKRTLDHRLPSKLIKIFRNHRDPVGMPVRLYEDSRGLYVAGKLNLQKQSGRDTLAELRSGELAHMSIAYDIVRDEFDRETETLHLHELKLYEVGPVYWPMNEAATVLAVKAARDAAGLPFPAPVSLGPLVVSFEATVEDLVQRGLKTNEDVRDVARAIARLAPIGEQLKALQEDQAPANATPADPDPPSEQSARGLELSLDELKGTLENLNAMLSESGIAA